MKILSELVKEIETFCLTFKDMAPEEQIRAVKNMSRFVTMSCAIVLIALFFPFVPAPIRLIAVPLILLGSWFVATYIVSSTVISQFDLEGRSSYESRTLEIIDVTAADETLGKVSIEPARLSLRGLRRRITIVLVGVFVGVFFTVLGLLFYLLNP